MNAHRDSWFIAFHFGWPLVFAIALFAMGNVLFQRVLLFGAEFAAVLAVLRGEPLRLRRVTLWDEAAALLGLCVATQLLP